MELLSRVPKLPQSNNAAEENVSTFLNTALFYLTGAVTYFKVTEPLPTL